MRQMWTQNLCLSSPIRACLLTEIMQVYITVCWHLKMENYKWQALSQGYNTQDTIV